MPARNILLIKKANEYTIRFDIAANVWTTYNDFLGCLKIIEHETVIASVTLDFSQCRGSLYPEVTISIAALVDYYRDSFGWSFACRYKKGTYIAHTNLLVPKRIGKDKTV